METPQYLRMLTPASLARTDVWRNHVARGVTGDLQHIFAEVATTVVFSHRGQLLTSGGALHRFNPHSSDGSDGVDGIDGTRIYLGETASGHVVGIELADHAKAEFDVALGTASSPASPQAPTWSDLRDIALTLDDTDTALATALVAVGNWHRTHTHSPRNGKPTTTSAGGWMRTDPDTGSEHFPRTDPAVIMGVVHTDDDGNERILLGNNASWPANKFSLLAGFVEPGETLEAAVVREVREESGVTCINPHYVGSQPWPFPCSLMVGFFATATTREAQADEIEMRDVRWFTREELATAIESGDISVPGRVSIAGQMLDMWIGGPTSA